MDSAEEFWDKIHKQIAAAMCCAVLSGQNSRAGERAKGRKQRIFVDFLFWSIMLGPQCMLCFYPGLKRLLPFPCIWVRLMTGWEAFTRTSALYFVLFLRHLKYRHLTSNSTWFLYCCFVSREDSTGSSLRPYISKKRLFQATFQMFESIQVELLETGCGSCCMRWRMIS